jgi:hypothetical protein
MIFLGGIFHSVLPGINISFKIKKGGVWMRLSGAKT